MIQIYLDLVFLEAGQIHIQLIAGRVASPLQRKLLYAAGAVRAGMIGKSNVSALLGQFEHNGAPNAPVAAGDQDGLVLQAHVL